MSDKKRVVIKNDKRRPTHVPVEPVLSYWIEDPSSGLDRDQARLLPRLRDRPRR